MSRTMKAAAVGLILAAIAHFVAAMVSGAGHGWTEPFLFSAVMWITLPLVAIRWSQHWAGSDRLRWLDWILLLTGILLNVLLATATSGNDQPEYFYQADLPILALWIAFWLSWQLAALLLVCSPLNDFD